VIGPKVEITPGELRTLALNVVSVLRYVDNTWPLNEYREKQLRHELDNLSQLHGCSVLGQKRPFYTTVRVYSEKGNLRTVSLQQIQMDLATRYGTNDCMFDLRIILLENSAVSSAYLLPWSVLQSSGCSSLGNIHLEPYQVILPDDIEPEHFQE
jgi:hypothetical protein